MGGVAGRELHSSTSKCRTARGDRSSIGRLAGSRSAVGKGVINGGKVNGGWWGEV